MFQLHLLSYLTDSFPNLRFQPESRLDRLNIGKLLVTLV